METSEEAGQEVFTAREEERISDAVACSRDEGKEEEEEVEVSFDELGLDEQLKRALRKKGITKATPIQREAIPLILVRGLWPPCSLYCAAFRLRMNFVQIFGLCNPNGFKDWVWTSGGVCQRFL